jgi:hypothetical protein
MISKWLHISGKAFRMRIYIQFPIYCTLAWRSWKSVVRNSLLCSIWTYRHLRFTATNCGEQTVAPYRGLYLVAEIKDSTPLISKPALGHDPEPFPCVSQVIGVIRVFLISMLMLFPSLSYFPSGDFQIIFFAEPLWAFLVFPISDTCPLDYNRLKILGDA